MSKQAQHPKHFSSRLSKEPLKNSAVRQSALQPKAARLHPQHGAQGIARTPLAPPAYRPQQPASPTTQAKMRASERLTPTRTASVLSGIVQANIIGGTHALQARLAFLKHAPGQHHTPQTIQRKSSPGVEAFQVPLQPKSGGQPIPDQVRAKMEAAFGTDFSDVRVHVGQEASSIGAIAYTWGTNIHFAPGQYSPHTIQGQKLLGHELWHVVQQKSGRVSNPFGGGVAVVQDHALEAEADRMGIKAAMTTLVQRTSDKT